MNNPVQSTVAFVADNAAWAGPFLGLIAFGESLALVGAFVPATPFLLLVGGLLGSGQLDPARVLPFAIVGAWAGYWLSYLAGRRLGYSFHTMPALAGHRRALARVRLFFRRYGAASLIVGRLLLGPLQSLLPLVAGAAAMGQRRFHVVNAISAVTWVLACLAPGYMAARGLTVLGFDLQQQCSAISIMVMISLAAAVASAAVLVTRYLRLRT